MRTGLKLIQSAGLKRTRGTGQVKLTLETLQTIAPYRAVEEGNWLRYRLKLQTPTALSEGTNAPTDADRKNFSGCLDHIPGSAVRGLVMSHLSRSDPEWFADHKDALLRQVLFRNALPLFDGHRQIPLPMGFYEDREQTRFYHVLNQDVVSGDKRARLRRYCRFDGTTVLHSSPTIASALRITISDPDSRTALDGKNRQMFTTDAMAAGTVLEGHIYIPDPALTPVIARAFQSWLSIGADRFGGSGLCSVELLDNQAPDDTVFSYRSGDPIPETLCMLILSPTALLKDGEVSGFTDEDLARLLQVPQAKIERCATSILRHSGFNRTWGCAEPIVSMYAPGSVLRIRCSQPPTPERLRELERTGVGIRRTEGCGQILFLRDFFQLTGHARAGSAPVVRTTSEQLLRRRARCRWLTQNDIRCNLSSSQLGAFQQTCENVLHGRRPKKDLEVFFRNNQKRSKYSKKYALLEEQLNAVLKAPLHETLGCAPFKDSETERLELFCELFDMNRKGASR